MRAFDIAGVCHEANRELTRLLGDVPVQAPWAECGSDMQASSVRGVEWRLANPDAPASAQHDAWMKERLAQGWVWGPVKNVETKQHSALVAYDKLPSGVQAKDAVFTAIVLALRGAP